MYAVIFTAELMTTLPDQDYLDTARLLRELAKREYGCRDLVSTYESGTEITVSYWDSLEQIERWKNDPRHLAAQLRGQTHWYKTYRVEIAEVVRSYSQDLEVEAR